MADDDWQAEERERVALPEQLRSLQHGWTDPNHVIVLALRAAKEIEALRRRLFIEGVAE
jgi:hypothetical protein